MLVDLARSAAAHMCTTVVCLTEEDCLLRIHSPITTQHIMRRKNTTQMVEMYTQELHSKKHIHNGTTDP